ncbi:hypothetical protein GQ457_10G010390 [Hibiscus cannabinus]
MASSSLAHSSSKVPFHEELPFKHRVLPPTDGIAYNLPRSETFEGILDILLSSKVGNNQRTTLHFNNIPEVIGCPTSQRPLNIHPGDVSTSAPAPIVDPEVLPQGPITRSKILAYNLPRSATYEETTFRQVTSYH